MTIKEYQSNVDDWIKTHGVRYFSELTNTVLLMEEMGEFSRLISRKFGEQSFKTEKSDIEVKKAIKDEMADMLFVITCLANQMNINLETAIIDNFKKKTARDKDRHKNNSKLS